MDSYIISSVPSPYPFVPFLSGTLQAPDHNSSPSGESDPSPHQSRLRLLTNLITGFGFAIALRFSTLTEPSKVIGFLLPFQPAFDPSLAYLAAGALPASTLLYQFCCSEQPRLGGTWNMHKGTIDTRLVTGAALFGIGWGIIGICRAFYRYP
jgi:uncharacterized membrane protein YedE/YeeE